MTYKFNTDGAELFASKMTTKEEAEKFPIVTVLKGK